MDHAQVLVAETLNLVTKKGLYYNEALSEGRLLK